MDTSPTEASPVQSTRGFKGVLAKARRGGKDTASSPSFFNGMDNNSSDSHGIIRSSVESLQALEKDRASRESSIDDGTTMTKSRTLAKLIPARIKKKLKKQGGPEREEEQGEDEHVDGRARHGNAITDPAPAATSTAGGSSRQNTVGGDSLISYDSDDETESLVHFFFPSLFTCSSTFGPAILPRTTRFVRLNRDRQAQALSACRKQTN